MSLNIYSIDFLSILASKFNFWNIKRLVRNYHSGLFATSDHDTSIASLREIAQNSSFRAFKLNFHFF